MEPGFDDYVVYIRFDHGAALEDMELPIASGSSYEEARRAFRASGWLNDLVIRYHGDVGGGD